MRGKKIGDGATGRKKISLLIAVLLAAAVPVLAQNLPESGQDLQPEDIPIELPLGFNRLLLGMNFNEVEQELKADGNFRYRGAPDVSLLRSPNDSLIECEGLFFIDRASFQFKDDTLFSITLILNTNTLGYYTMFSTLQSKYGDPDWLSPEKAVWENEEIQLALERPLRLKYIAKPVLDELKRGSERAESLRRIERERFLEQF